MNILSVIILTRNEEANLPICLRSLAPLNAKVFVIDSGSTDRTIEIAKNADCHVAFHAWENHAAQVNWAIKNLPITTPWVMRLDADERLMPELVEELHQVLPRTPQEISGYQVKRRVFFMGRWIRHGGYYPTWLLRIWRNGYAICEQRWMDEHIVLTQGKVANLQFDIIDENQKGLSFWIDKHNRYADREVYDVLEQQARSDELLEAQPISQASQRRWIKSNLYNRFPRFIRVLIYFLLRYVIGLGFLDGIEGLIFHVLQGFWYRFLVDAKIYELSLKQKRQESSNPV